MHSHLNSGHSSKLLRLRAMEQGRSSEMEQSCGIRMTLPVRSSRVSEAGRGHPDGRFGVVPHMNDIISDSQEENEQRIPTDCAECTPEAPAQGARRQHLLQAASAHSGRRQLQPALRPKEGKYQVIRKYWDGVIGQGDGPVAQNEPSGLENQQFGSAPSSSPLRRPR